MHEHGKASSDVVLIAVFVRRRVADTDTEIVCFGMVFIDRWQACKLERMRIDVPIMLSWLGFPHPKPEIQHSSHGSSRVSEKLEQELPLSSVEIVKIACSEDWISGMLLSVPMAVVIAAAPPGF